MFKIGIDIGGTNTDAVLVNHNNEIIKTAKVYTTSDMVTGLVTAINAVTQQHKNIGAIIVGTTHVINSLLEVKNLTKIGVIRLAGHYPNTIPVGFKWPQKLKNAIIMGTKTIPGGCECDGSDISPLNKTVTLKAVNQLINAGAEGLVIAGIFSSIYPQQELIIKNWLKDELGKEFPITLASDIGGIGLIERENAAILNTALQQNLTKGFQHFQKELQNLDLTCPIWITKNNGTVMTINEVMQYPVFTLAAGPKNSFVGGAKLADFENAVVADIGGTSTDVGIVIDGFVRQTFKPAEVAGVRLGFAMPDLLTIGLGGGSHIEYINAAIKIGPSSAGNALLQQMRSLGGVQLTLTDAAIVQGTINIPGAKSCLNPKIAAHILDQAYKTIQQMYAKIAGFRKDLPLVIVGGGAELFRNCNLSTQVSIPTYSASANAYGAAMAEIGTTINTIINLKDRTNILPKLESEALAQAKTKGADSPRIIEKQVIPYYYAPENIARVVITAAGALCIQ